MEIEEKNENDQAPSTSIPPRNGRLASEILQSVEADVGLENGRPSTSTSFTLCHDVRELLYRLGESKRGMPLCQTLELQARELSMLLSADMTVVTDAFIESAISLPTQTPLLATVAAFMQKIENSKKNISSRGIFSRSLCNKLSSALVKALHRGDSQSLRLLVRFLACLGLVHIVSVQQVLDQLSILIQASKQRPKREARSILYAVLSSLPWLASTSPGPAEHLGLAEFSTNTSTNAIQSLWDDIVIVTKSLFLEKTDEKLSSCIALSPQHQLPALPDESGGTCGATQWIDADLEVASRLGIDLVPLIEDPVKNLFEIMS
jgi:hypothetical protein